MKRLGRPVAMSKWTREDPRAGPPRTRGNHRGDTMSTPEYTPTTEEVMLRFAYQERPANGTSPELMAAFNRWLEDELNAARAEGWDRSHGAPCDTWVVDEMCGQFHPNPYRKEARP